MKLSRIVFALILVSTLVTIAEAGKENGDLTLYKDPILEFTSARGIGSICQGPFTLEGGKDTPDLRNNLRNFHCQGKFSLAMEGPKDKMITLFGGFNYSKENGFMIIRKTNDKKVWIPDLMNHPANQWVSVTPPTGHDEEYGTYEVFYSPTPNFDQKLASLKWGQWWKGGNPN